MKRKIIYQTIITGDSAELDTLVNSNLAEGWQLVGGLSMCIHAGRISYGQAISRVEQSLRVEINMVEPKQRQDIY
jgi:hypothetical protein